MGRLTNSASKEAPSLFFLHPLPPLYLALLELNSHGGWYQTRLQIRSPGLAAASERANRGLGCAVVGVKIWTVDRVTAGRNALTCPSVPAVDQTQSSHLNPTGAGFCAVGVRLRVRGCLDHKRTSLPPHWRGGTRSVRGVSLDQLVRVGSAGDAAPG